MATLDQTERATSSESAWAVREICLSAAIILGVLIVGITEFLSGTGWLGYGPLLLAWGAVLVGGVLLGVRCLPLQGALPRRVTTRFEVGLDVAMDAWVLLLVALTGALALFAVPTNWDSMIYHLARVAHWTQNHTVAFYPTHVIRQLHPPPWAEFAMLHLFILAGGDRLVNLVQWGSMVGSLIGVSLIARELGASVRGQVLSAFVCVTIPIGIRQASSTQNDYVAALWLVCLIHALLLLDSHPGPVPVLSAGASLGLAWLTKGTTYIFAAPFLLVFLLGGRRRSGLRKVGHALVIGYCALALNGLQYSRNLELFGAPLGPGGEGGEYRYMNRELSARIFASNVLRNLGLHLGTPWPAVNSAIERTIGAAHTAIGIAPDDPRSTWPTTRFAVLPPVAHEDLAPNGLHLLLIAAAILAVWRTRSDGRLKAYAGCLVMAFLVFCFLLRWQPWHTRLHLPLFVLGAPLVGVVLSRLNTKLLFVVLLALAGSSVYFLAANHAYPLVGRRGVFTTAWAEQRAAYAGPAYVGATRFVMSSGCRYVGLALGSNDPEYFVWALLKDAGWQGRLQAVLVSNASARLANGRRPSSPPCAIMRVAAGLSTAESGLSFGERHYRPEWSEEPVQVLMPGPPPVVDSPASAGPPVAHLLLDRTRFRSGERVTIGLEARNPLDGVAADLYVGVLLPDGRSAVFVGPSGVLSNVVSLTDPSAFPAARQAAPGFTLSARTFVEFTVPPEVPPGTYRVFAALARQRTARWKSMPPEDALASDVRDLVLSR